MPVSLGKKFEALIASQLDDCGVCFEKIKGSCLPEVGKGAGSTGNCISNLLNYLCDLSNILFLVHYYGVDWQPRNTVKTLIYQRVKQRLLYSEHTF